MDSKRTLAQTPDMNQPWDFSSVVNAQTPARQDRGQIGARTALDGYQPATGTPVDIHIVRDDTGSMAGSCLREPIAMASVRAVDVFDEAGLDARMGLISYGDEAFGEQPHCYPVGTPPDAIRYAIMNDLGFNGYDEEESTLLALHRALHSTGYRPDAQKVLLLATDAPPRKEEKGVNVDTVLQELKAARAILIACAPKHPDFVKLANSTGGLLIEISPGLPPQAFHDALMAAVKATVTTVTAETAKRDVDLQRQIAQASQEFQR